MKTIEIYTNKTCPYCKQIKEEMTKQGVVFENKDTSENKSEWQEIVNLTGIPTVPTIKCNDEYFVPNRDFGSPEQLVIMLKTYSDSPYNQSKRIFEKIKTLNYNMGQAFQKMDQLIRQIETKLNIE
tara:strand:- start:338 stop:715 length:378 start_codon:yes stop_codon:yes gene_type:complete